MKRQSLTYPKVKRRKVDCEVYAVIAGVTRFHGAGDRRADIVVFSDIHGNHVMVLSGYGTPIEKFRCDLSPVPRQFTVDWIRCHSDREYSFTATTSYGKPFTGHLIFSETTPLEITIYPRKEKS